LNEAAFTAQRTEMVADPFDFDQLDHGWHGMRLRLRAHRSYPSPSALQTMFALLRTDLIAMTKHLLFGI
jgi:hypothetical protein